MQLFIISTYMGMGARSCWKASRLMAYTPADPLAPLGCRWLVPRTWKRNVKSHQLDFYRNEFDMQQADQVQIDKVYYL